MNLLVSVRVEDWFRFARESATQYRILEPYLDFAEARELFGIIRSQGRLAPSMDSAERAWEKLESPHLLMEYVYLLTHGTMLHERLAEQVRAFRWQGEDAKFKLSVLRIVSLAARLGTPLNTRAVLGTCRSDDDPQHLLQSLNGEYVLLSAASVEGMHWVRSRHLAALLHEGYPNAAETALQVLDGVPPVALASFVAHALVWPELDREHFCAGILSWVSGRSHVEVAEVLDGLFEGGERLYIVNNRTLLEEVGRKIGPQQMLLLTCEIMPIARG
jgi:hypothetical protein